MKCTNPVGCTGEMSSYKGLEAGKVECKKCGYRIDAPKVVKPVEKKEVSEPKDKENK